ncbi:MAG: malonyl-ACP O-methyltransferase BioC [Betaproteobacteria bacterium]|jgi:malonyl-CoA O-methyltransferase|nr:malonyl-ACP O-methyltransferase BioC [Betaproteobacteria bacterium]HMV20484.1 malonyl-ACP O-methyltransferase BioC [Rhodocyclaceae bacterium]HNE43257.1 malonyl-ACP O-methyltransferase BioC [Rhodocyclaceae bacterium]HNM79594.1 malonyl-ACP O-methyltransferase BioC [Rhodocyclaceae bacterium]HNP04189.1 malonyl-ACP O-methyltransferase BioC [Rhodocyclaceae bacterium]
MLLPTKLQVRRAFEKAVPSYDAAARVQRRVCGWLAQGLPATVSSGAVVDVGCGTGHALRLLRERFPAGQLIAVDLVPAMLRQVPPHLHAQSVVGDAECLPLAEACAGLYWSSLTLQWCDLGRSLAEARRVLTKGGHLAIGTLGPDTYSELRAAFAYADRHRHTLDFLTPKAISEAAAGFSDLRLERRRETVYFPDLRALLNAIKALGANQLAGRRNGLMGRQAWQRAESAYESLRGSDGLPLTYDIVLLHARR